MKKLVFGLVATVMFSVTANATTEVVKPINPVQEKNINLKDEDKPVVRVKIIKYIIAAVSSWFGGDDGPTTVYATGAYSNRTCNAINNNVCNFTHRVSNTKPLDIKDLIKNSTVLDTPVMKKVLELDQAFITFDENGSVYLTASDKTKDSLFTSGAHTQQGDAYFSEEQLQQINSTIQEIKPGSATFRGLKSGTKLVPENGNDGFIYIRLN
jgi:hypothetical protein